MSIGVRWGLSTEGGRTWTRPRWNRNLGLILGARPDPLDLLDLDAYSPEPQDEPGDEEVGTSAADEAEDDEED
jgi:hypothetical protein